MMSNDIRDRLVQILSVTANACLNEVGYHPDIRSRLQIADHRVSQLLSENTKLYQDNCRLHSLFLQSPSKANHFNHLNNHIRFLTQQRETADRQIFSLHDQYRKASDNFNSLRQLHATALNDISDLRAELARLREQLPSDLSRPSPPQNALVPAPPVQQQTSSAPVPGNLAPFVPTLTLKHPRPPPLNTLQPPNFVPNAPRSSSSTPTNTPYVISAPPTVSMSRMVHNPAYSPIANYPYLYPSSSLPAKGSLKRKSITPTTPFNRFSPVDSPKARTPGTQAVQLPPAIEQKKRQQSVHQDNTTICKKPRIEPPPSGPPVKLKVEQSPRLPSSANPNLKSDPEPNHQPRTEQPPAAANLIESIAKPAEPETKPVPMPDQSDDEDSDDEVIEVDADGIPLPEACVAIIMETDANNANLRWCRICRARFKTRLVSEPPKPFVDATMDDLIKHCTTVHPAGWNCLRKRVSQK